MSKIGDEMITKSEPFEIQYDLKPQGAVIRINTASGCVLRICKIPEEQVFDEQGNVRNFVDMSYPKENQNEDFEILAGQRVMYRGVEYETGNCHHNEVELYKNCKFVRTVKIKVI